MERGKQLKERKEGSQTVRAEEIKNDQALHVLIPQTNASITYHKHVLINFCLENVLLLLHLAERRRIYSVIVIISPFSNS